MKKTGIAVVGYGGMGGWHCRKISEIEELELVGVYDILDSRNAAAEENGIHASFYRATGNCNFRNASLQAHRFGD